MDRLPLVLETFMVPAMAVAVDSPMGAMENFKVQRWSMKIKVPDNLLFKVTPAQYRALELVLPKIQFGLNIGVCVRLHRLANEHEIEYGVYRSLEVKIRDALGYGAFLHGRDFGVPQIWFSINQYFYRRAWVKALLKHNEDVKP